MKTSELQGSALAWAVTKCEGYSHDISPDGEWGKWGWATDWAQGGPIIEREGIELLCESLGFRWVATPQKGPEWRGTTPLIAAMRCYVASKLGDDIELPEELK